MVSVANNNLVSKQQSKLLEKPMLQSPKLNGPPDHIAFVIHGIGQQTEQFGFFQTHLQSLYDTTNKAVKENTPDKEVNIQYIPIEWHKHIHEETDAIMDDITLSSIPFMRMINNEYLSDAFFYLSKDRGQSIINHVTKTFNEAYSGFINENPDFQGKVAILAYSLGGIIAWDILSNQLQKNIKHISKLDMTFPRLDFKPDYLFTLGSPLSAFLTVRNQDPKVYHPHPSIIFENIYHPYDPLAYRLEPMLKINYKHQPAMLVEKCVSEQTSYIWNKGCDIISSLTRQHERLVTLLSKEKQQHIDYFRSTLLSSGGNILLSTLKRYFSTNASLTPQYDPIRPMIQAEEEEVDSNTSTPKMSLDCGSEIEEEDQDYFLVPSDFKEKEFTYIAHTDMTTTSCKRRHQSYDHCSPTKRRRNSLELTKEDQLPNRIDFVLRPEKLFGCVPKNEYFSGLTAHFSYWTHKDLMWHIVRRLENTACNYPDKTK
ncbi:hypothetical protein MFLAVUS_000739 [Mucor flavus]|uniref:DDHD domain-containing protein n=1 Tax=Mucor flavus TaxID=439312 RepID=A0ABP9YKM0_9FUNG